MTRHMPVYGRRRGDRVFVDQLWKGACRKGSLNILARNDSDTSQAVHQVQLYVLVCDLYLTYPLTA